MKLIVLLTALITWSFEPSAFAVELSSNEVCRTVAAHKENAVLLTEHKDQIVKHIQLGDFDFSDKASTNDFIPSTQRFKLIVRPANIVLEDFCSMSVCIEKNATRSTCPNSNEYLVTFQINPTKFGSGKFDSEIDLHLFNKKEQLPVDESFHLDFERKVKGVLHMPYAEIVQRGENSNNIIQLIKGNDQHVDLELINSGNKPLKIGKWDQLDQSDGTLSLDSSACQNITLPPGSICRLSLRNPSRKPVTSKYLYWFNHYYENGLNISLYLTPRHDGTIDYNIKNN
jgi:hypothetical protein